MTKQRRDSRSAAATTAPALSLRVLGELTVERDGRRAELPPSKKTRALLGYLLVEPREHTREDLCALFWDGPDDPRGALRWSLSRLRPLLEGPSGASLVADRDRVQLEPGDARVDWRVVQALHAKGLAAATEEELRSASALFRGELLEGLELTDAYRFHAWCTAWREEARKLRTAVGAALADRLSDRPEEALPVARSLVAQDPMAEAAHARVMRLLAALGRPKEAIQQYDECREVLRAQLGARPSAAIEEIRRGLGVGPPVASPGVGASGARAPPGLQPTPAPEPRAPARPADGAVPCIGREGELAAAEAALRAMPPKIALLLGDAGIGKTRLLEELAARARAAGMEVVSGRSHEAELARPYGPFVDALRASGLLHLAGEGLRQDLSALLPELSAAALPADRSRLYDAVAALLLEAARAGPVLLVLDDAHWIDEASASLAHYLARTLAGRGVAVAVAARGGELPDNPAAQRLIRALKREGLVVEIAVPPLGPDAVARLLTAGGLRADAARVHLGSQGNPLYALEIGRALDAGRPLASGTLAEILDERLSVADDAAQGVLAFGAALGRAWELPLLAAATGRPTAELLDALSSLERHGLVRARDDAAWDFVHDLVREAAFRRVDAPRRRAIHAAVARALWDDPEGRRSLATAVARHALEAGDDALHVRASVCAAQHSLRVFAAQEAYAIAQRALLRASALTGAEGRAARLSLLEASVFSRAAPAERLEADLAALSELVMDAEAVGDSTVAAGAFHVISWTHFFREDERSALSGSLQSAEIAKASKDPLVRARSLAQAGRCLAQVERDIPEAVALLDEAAGAAREAQVALTDLPLGRGLIEAFNGDRAAFATLEQGANLAHAAGDHWRESECLFALTRFALEVGDAQGALGHARRVLPVATRLAGGFEPAQARALVALAELWAGDESAAARLDAACDDLRRHEGFWRLAQVLLLRGERALLAGDPDEAERRAREALALDVMSAVETRLARCSILFAEVALARGDFPAALEHANRAVAATHAPSALLRSRLTAISARLAARPDPTPPHTPPSTQPGQNGRRRTP